MMDRSNGLLLFLGSVMIGYLCLGAFMFSFIQQPIEKQIKQDLRVLRRSFLISHPSVDAEDLDAYMKTVLEADESGVRIVKNITSLPNWDFGQSFFFAGTILTTLGYGHVAPLSEAGKLFCMGYALLGIPMTFILITALSQRLLIFTNMLLQHLKDKMEHVVRGLYIDLLHMALVLTVISLLILFLPAVVFNLLEEKWNYLDALYYCVISMTSVGLGDYIPGEYSPVEHRSWYKITTTFFLIGGLVLAITAVSTILSVPQLNVNQYFFLQQDTAVEAQAAPDKECLHLNSQQHDSYTQSELSDTR